MKETRFKDTEIGRIPEDWEVIKLGDSFEFKNGLNASKECFGSGTPIINYTDVYKHTSLKAEWIKGRVNLSAKDIDRFRVKRNDVFFTRTSETPEEVGLPSVLLDTINDCVFSGFVLRARPINKFYVPEYCAFCFRTNQIRLAIINSCTYTTRALTNGKVLSSIPTPIPPLSEQTRIASALTSIDNLISSLDKLIEKKKAIKEGTMQQLLTGKKRLKGFNDPWVEKELGELGTLECVPINPQFFTNCVFAEYSMPSFDEDRNPRFVKGQEMCSSRLAIEGEVLLINKLNVRQKRIWYLNECGNNAVCSGEFLPYKSSKVNLIFLRNILLTNKVVNDFVNMSTGTSNSQKRVKPSNVLSYKINIPLDINEQKAIANMLTSMDNEITVLEAKRDKYIKTKQGMMQQLLTGRIRLV